MATHSSILAWKISLESGTWRATVHGVTKSQRLEYACRHLQLYGSLCRKQPFYTWLIMSYFLRRFISSITFSGKFAWFFLIHGLQLRQRGKAKIFEEMVRVSWAHLDLLSAHHLNHWLFLQQSDVHSCNPRVPCLDYDSPSSFLRPTRCVNLEENGT